MRLGRSEGLLTERVGVDILYKERVETVTLVVFADSTIFKYKALWGKQQCHAFCNTYSVNTYSDDKYNG